MFSDETAVGSRQFFNAKEAAFYFGIGRTKIYELIAAGDLRCVKIGRRTLIPASSLASYARSLEQSVEPE